MSAIEYVDTGQPMARINLLRVLEPHLVEIEWAEGARAGYADKVDLWPAIGSYKIYRPLRHNAELFARAQLCDDGRTISWGSDDLEMSADLAEHLAEETMSSEQFAAFLVRNRLTQQDAAALLGRSRRQIGYYLNPGPVPRIVYLACVGYETLVSRHRKTAA